MECGRDFGFEKKQYRISGKEEILANGRAAKIEKEDLKSKDLPKAKTYEYEQSGSLPVSKMALAPQYDD